MGKEKGMRLATYTEYAGRRAVRLDRELAVPRDEVWAAVSTPTEMKAWFPSEVEFDPTPGETVHFFGDPNAAEGSTGTVLIHDAPEKFAFLWGFDEIHLLVDHLDSGHTRLSLINVLADPGTASRTAAGWTVCLNALAKHLTGKGDDDLTWQVAYDAHVEAGVPAGAAIPGSTAKR